jgi:hypothetical protein
VSWPHFRTTFLTIGVVCYGDLEREGKIQLFFESLRGEIGLITIYFPLYIVNVRAVFMICIVNIFSVIKGAKWMFFSSLR